MIHSPVRTRPSTIVTISVTHCCNSKKKKEKYYITILRSGFKHTQWYCATGAHLVLRGLRIRFDGRETPEQQQRITNGRGDERGKHSSLIHVLTRQMLVRINSACQNSLRRALNLNFMLQLYTLSLDYTSLMSNRDRMRHPANYLTWLM